jgi:hypothetical protein
MTAAADQLPDLLGLRRLDAALRAEAEAEAGTPLVTEEVFLTKPSNGASPVAAVEDEKRSQLLLWLNEYAKNQVLFHHDDIAGLRTSLETMPADQLSRWAADSEQLRARLFDSSWLATQQWLRDFLAVQAIYTDDDVTAFRRGLASLRPSQLLRVMDHFQTVQLARARSREAADQLRVQQIAIVGRRPLGQQTVRAASFSGNARFPSNVGERAGGGPTRQYMVVRRPMLSQRIANYYINRAIYGNRFFGWGWFWP